MRKMLTLLLAAALCLLAAGALAGSYGTAVIQATSGKLHLRAEPTAYSDSYGLYFTGTEVECLSNPNREWVEVQIERETGYMMSKYLRWGDDADRVTPRFMRGTVTAKNYGRLRAGPSTEYQLIANAYNGDTVTIMGETVDHWYYVQLGRETGFISSGLVRLEGEATSSPSGSGSASASVLWRRVYRDWVRRNGRSDYRYELIYVNEDSIPELAVDTGVEASGCMILTCDGSGYIDVLQTRRRGFSYIRRGNALCNSDGSMDSYFDDVYTIDNGAWRLVASGVYYGYKDGWDNEQERYICETYVWNGRETTMEGYLQALDRVYPPYSVQYPVFGYNHNEMLNVLQ